MVANRRARGKYKEIFGDAKDGRDSGGNGEGTS